MKTIDQTSERKKLIRHRILHARMFVVDIIVSFFIIKYLSNFIL